MTPIIRKINSLLYPLEDFYAESGRPLPVIAPLAGDDLPQPYRRLLVHERDMTSTLESFAGGPLHLRVIQMKEHAGALVRHVVLETDDGDQAVEYGAIRIQLDRFPDPARAEVTAARRPLGTILHQFRIGHRCRPAAYFRIDGDRAICDVFRLDETTALYGRHAVLHDAYDELLAEVVEILPPLTEPGP